MTIYRNKDCSLKEDCKFKGQPSKERFVTEYVNTGYILSSENHVFCLFTVDYCDVCHLPCATAFFAFSRESPLFLPFTVNHQVSSFLPRFYLVIFRLHRLRWQQKMTRRKKNWNFYTMIGTETTKPRQIIKIKVEEYWVRPDRCVWQIVFTRTRFRYHSTAFVKHLERYSYVFTDKALYKLCINK